MTTAGIGRNGESRTPTGPIRGVVFDLDGTLVKEQHDYDAIRRELGLAPKTPVLEGVASLSAAEQRKAQEVLYRHEQAAAHTAVLNPGVADFVEWLDAREIKRGLFSRNSRAAVAVVLARCQLRFEKVVAREDAPHKPRPDGLLRICGDWGFSPCHVLMIGDYLFDIQAGAQAGTRTALITHGRSLPFADLADVAFSGFEAIPEMLREWFGDGEASATRQADEG